MVGVAGLRWFRSPELRFIAAIAFTTGATLTGIGTAAAVAGELDLTFGANGSTMIDVGGTEFGNDMTIDGYGRIIVVGSTTALTSSESDVVLVRLTAAGAFDETFGDGGVVVVDVGFRDEAIGVGLQPDGRIVFAGSTVAHESGPSDILTGRMNDDGSLDTTYGDNGVAVVNLGGYESARASDLQSDGALVVGGGTFLIRVDNTGVLDTAFGTDGIADVSVHPQISSLVVRHNDTIVVGGSPAGRSFGVTAYTSDGRVDTTFGSAGSTSSSLFQQAAVYSIDSDPQGGIVASGHMNTSVFNIDLAVMRLHADGTLDTSFSDDGHATAHHGVGDLGNDVAIASDGKIVAGGSFVTAFTGAADVGLVRFNADGTLDASFGTNGVVVVNLGRYEFMESIALQGNGRIVVSGMSAIDVGRRGANIQVARFLPSDDSTSPSIVGIPDREPNSAGWHNTPVGIDWVATDDSGSASDPPNGVASTEGYDVEYISSSSCDPTGNCATGSLTLSIDATPPTVGAIQVATSPARAGTTVDLTAVVGDSLSGLDHVEYVIEVDSEARDPVAMAVADGVSQATISPLPAGLYDVSVTAFDRAGNSSTSPPVELVVIDPNAGFVTGGGRIVPGAADGGANILPGLDGTSSASFSLVVKYNAGKGSTPTGNLTFHDPAGSFRMKADSMDWLIVADGGWSALQGSASVTGSTGLHPFRVIALDGGPTLPDQIDISVWAPGSDPALDLPVYRAAGTVQGSIVVHQT